MKKEIWNTNLLVISVSIKNKNQDIRIISIYVILSSRCSDSILLFSLDNPLTYRKKLIYRRSRHLFIMGSDSHQMFSLRCDSYHYEM